MVSVIPWLIFLIALAGFTSDADAARISAKRSFSTSREWSTVRKYSQHVPEQGLHKPPVSEDVIANTSPQYVPMTHEEVAEVVSTLINSINAESDLDMDLPTMSDGSTDVLVTKLTETVSSISQLLGRLIKYARKASAKKEDVVEVNVSDDEEGKSSLMWGLVSSMVGAATYVPRKATGLAMNATSAVANGAVNLGTQATYKVLDSVVPTALHTSSSAALAASFGASVALSPFLALIEKLDSDLLPLLLSANTLDKKEKVRKVVERLFRTKEGVKATVLEQLHASSSQCRTVIVLQGNTGFGWSEWSWMLIWHALPKFLQGIADDVERMIATDIVDEATLQSWGEKWHAAEKSGMEDFHRTFALRHCESVSEFVKHVASQGRHECNDNARVILTGHGSGGAIAMSLGQAYTTSAVAFGAFGACGTDAACATVPEQDTSWNIVNIYGLAHKIGESRAHLCGYDLQDNGCGTNLLIHGTSFFRLLSSWSVGLVSQTLQSFADNTFGVSVALTSWIDALKCQQRENSWEILRATIQRHHSRWSLKCDAEFPMTRGELEDEVRRLRQPTTTTTTTTAVTSTLPIDACEKFFKEGCTLHLGVKSTSHFRFLSDPVPLDKLKEISGQTFSIMSVMDMKYDDVGWLVSGVGSAFSDKGTTIVISIDAFTIPVGARSSIPKVRFGLKESKFELVFDAFQSKSMVGGVKFNGEFE